MTRSLLLAIFIVAYLLSASRAHTHITLILYAVVRGRRRRRYNVILLLLFSIIYANARYYCALYAPRRPRRDGTLCKIFRIRPYNTRRVYYRRFPPVEPVPGDLELLLLLYMCAPEICSYVSRNNEFAPTGRSARTVAGTKKKGLLFLFRLFLVSRD